MNDHFIYYYYNNSSHSLLVIKHIIYNNSQTRFLNENRSSTGKDYLVFGNSKIPITLGTRKCDRRRSISLD